MTVPVALVTGASSGFGAASAASLLAAGFRVVGTSRRAVWPTSLRSDAVNLVPLDVCEDSSVAELHERLDRWGWRPDTLVLNAGYSEFGALETLGVDVLHRQLETNFYGVHRVVQAFLPEMRRSGRGRVIVIGSVAGRVALPFQGAYVASKFALAGYCWTLRQELLAFGVRVVLVEPGDHATGFSAARREDGVAATDPYEPQRSDALRAYQRAERSGPPPTRVAKTVLRACRARSRRFRYSPASLPERIACWLSGWGLISLVDRLVLGTFNVPVRRRPEPPQIR